MDDAASLAGALAALLRELHPDAADLRVGPLRRAGAGISTENWLFDASWTDARSQRVTQPLVLRRAPASEVVQTARDDEFHLLRALHGRGVRSPRAIWLDPGSTRFDRPAMLLERCPGRADRQLLAGRNELGLSLEQRLRLAGQAAATLAAIHRVDAASLKLEAPAFGERDDPARAELRVQQEALRRQGAADSVELSLAAWWLHDHAPPRPPAQTLVHGDFRPANLLVDAGELSAVLDWELAHVGDPCEDLGWYLAPVYRDEHLIPGHWTAEHFLAAYVAAGGRAVDPSRLRYWQVFALFKLAVIADTAVRAFVAGDAARLAPYHHGLLAALMSAVADTADARRAA